MEFKYNQHGADRKRLVQAVAEYQGVQSRYLNAPTFAYEAGFCTIDRNGTIVTAGEADSGAIAGLIDYLLEQGFKPEQGKNMGLTIALPRVGLSDEDIENFVKLIEGKGSLIQKALGADRLDVKLSEDKISLPWFDEMPEAEMIDAVNQLACKLLEKAKEQKRVTLQDKPVENEKYAFRCFLLRLGFIGDEYKDARKALLKNLEGNAAFKAGKLPDTLY